MNLQEYKAMNTDKKKIEIEIGGNLGCVLILLILVVIPALLNFLSSR